MNNNMENKLDLKKELLLVKEDIIQMTNDSEKASELINKLLKIKEDLDYNPIELNVGKKIDSLESNSFSIIKTDQGVLYKERGGYSVFTTPSFHLYNVLVDFVENQNAEIDDELKEDYETMLEIIGYCLQMPKYIPHDFQLSIDVAIGVVRSLEKLQKKYIDNAELQDETPIENMDFVETLKALRTIKETLKE